MQKSKTNMKVFALSIYGENSAGAYFILTSLYVCFSLQAIATSFVWMERRSSNRMVLSLFYMRCY